MFCGVFGHGCFGGLRPGATFTKRFFINGSNYWPSFKYIASTSSPYEVDLPKVTEFFESFDFEPQTIFGS